MSIPFTLLVAFLVFCLGIGIGTTIKFYRETTPILIIRFLTVLPFQTILLTIIVFIYVTLGVFEDVFNDDKKRKSPISSVIIGTRLVFLSFSTCVIFMPIFAGKMAHIAINEKKRVKHSIKRAKNECYPLVVDDILCRYA